MPGLVQADGRGRRQVIVFDRNRASRQTTLKHVFQPLSHGGPGLTCTNDIDVLILAQIVHLASHGQGLALPCDRMLYRCRGVHRGNASIKDATGIRSQLCDHHAIHELTTLSRLGAGCQQATCLPLLSS